MATSWGSDGAFTRVHCGPLIQTLYIVIPGVGSTLRPGSWADGNQDIWLKSIEPESAHDVGIFMFENQLCAGKPLSWQQIQEEGANFVSALENIVDKDEVRKSPIVLIAHSLGGLILKRAMDLAHRQPQRFQNVIKNIAGVIFLGCPHSRSSDVKMWHNISLICRTYIKGKTKHPVLSNLASNLADDCASFEHSFDQVPTLSLYETADTRIRGLIVPSKVLLVGKESARLNMRLEMLIGAKGDHGQMTRIQFGSLEFLEVAKFINRVVHDARQVIRRSSEEFIRSAAVESTIAESHFGTGLDYPTVTISSRPSLPIHTTQGGTVGSTVASIEMIPSLADFTTEKTDPVLPCYIIPLIQNPRFFGRSKILEEIGTALSPSSDTSENLKTYALSGPGGMGKTQIATEFVYRSKSQFDAIFWVTADEPSKMATSFGNIATTLGLVAKDSPNASDDTFIRDLVLGWLANPLKSYNQTDQGVSKEATWLIVFDNVDDPDVLDDYWPKGSSGAVLITSRDSLIKNYIYSANSGMSLPPFTDEEANSLLLKLTGREQDAEDGSQSIAVAKALGGYPLAITQLAPVIARNHYGFQEFLEMYEKDKTRRQLLDEQTTTRSEYRHTLATVWASEDLQKGAPLLEVLSLLDPDGIPEYILHDNKAVSGWLEYPQDPRAFVEARKELLHSSLITRNISERKIVIHRLTQDSARAKMNDRQFNAVYQFTCTLLSSVWPYEPFSFGNETYRWDQCDELFTHALRLHRHFDLDRLKPPTTVNETTIQAYKFFLDAAWFSIMRSRFSETRPLLDTAHQIGLRLATDQEEIQALPLELRKEFEHLQRIYYHHSGALAEHTNDNQGSLSNFSKFTEMLQDKFGDAPTGNDQSLGVAWNELGNSFLQFKQFPKAEECHRKSIKALSVLDGATKISTNMPLINLAYTKWVAGELDEASKLFEEALADRVHAYGLNDRTSFVTGKLYLGLGNVRASQNRFEESLDLHQKCLAHYKATVGNFHHRTGDGCVRVAHHFIRLGDYSRALDLLEQALRIFSDRKLWGPDRARALFKKGRALELQGDVLAATKCFEEAVHLWRERHPEARPILGELTDEDFDADIFFWSR